MIGMSQQRRLSYVLLLNVTMITGLLIVGLTSHSLGVLAAGGDFIADSTAIALGLMAVYLRDKPANIKPGNEDLHMRSVLLDTISDGLAAAAVAIKQVLSEYCLANCHRQFSP
jgi:hypothetical protein